MIPSRPANQAQQARKKKDQSAAVRDAAARKIQNCWNRHQIRVKIHFYANQLTTMHTEQRVALGLYTFKERNDAAYIITSFFWRIGHERRVDKLHRVIMSQHSAARLLQKKMKLWHVRLTRWRARVIRYSAAAVKCQQWWRLNVAEQRLRGVRLHWDSVCEVSWEEQLKRKDIVLSEKLEWQEFVRTIVRGNTRFNALLKEWNDKKCKTHAENVAHEVDLIQQESIYEKRRLRLLQKSNTATGLISPKHNQNANRRFSNVSHRSFRSNSSSMSNIGVNSPGSGTYSRNANERTSASAVGTLSLSRAVVAQTPLRYWYGWFVTTPFGTDVDIQVERMLLQEVSRRDSMMVMMENTIGLMVRAFRKNHPQF